MLNKKETLGKAMNLKNEWLYCLLNKIIVLTVIIWFQIVNYLLLIFREQIKIFVVLSIYF